MMASSTTLHPFLIPENKKNLLALFIDTESAAAGGWAAPTPELPE